MSPRQDQLIAPPWHTLGVLVLLAALSTFAFLVGFGSDTPKLGHTVLFIIITASEWIIFAFCMWRSSPEFGFYIRRSIQRGGSSIVGDIVAVLLLGAATVLGAPLVIHLLGKTGWSSTEGMRPRNGAEIVLWIVMALTAGVCEETVYRGYLQRQFSAWTGSTAAGVMIQAVIFGLSHAYQGVKYVLLIIVIGCLYGVAAVVRRGLRANMICHALLDIAAAF